ncbi:MAG TPA: terminase family protein, partial [Terriglobia bacterium]|nr:terminase family protein [Terriglobia bacterium]
MARRTKSRPKVTAQIGPQTQFLDAKSDLVVYGGAAGGGKTFALLLEALRFRKVPGFGAVIFRRVSPQITNQGGLWDEACKLFPQFGGVPRRSSHHLSWTFPAGTRISFRHLQYEETVLDWQGSQVPLIGFDELTHFTERQFWYMLSRNRSICGVKPYMRATCNPDADSWVADLLAWWIDQE